jgi:7-cyano-7-deazaguanine reductase
MSSAPGTTNSGQSVANDVGHSVGDDVDTSGLTVLGQSVRHPIDHLEWFDAPAHVTTVRFAMDELQSLCPVTQQPDLSSLVIEYRPDRRCIESKSLKLYLWSFRERRVFCEALAAEIAGEVVRAVDPHEVRVTVTQHPRGGITTTATAERRKDDGKNDNPNENGEASR